MKSPDWPLWEAAMERALGHAHVGGRRWISDVKPSADGTPEFKARLLDEVEESTLF